MNEMRKLMETTAQLFDDIESSEEPVAEDDWDNAPDEEYSDHQTMTHDLSGGINRRKNSYKRAEPGDNPMAVESSLREEEENSQVTEEWKPSKA